MEKFKALGLSKDIISVLERKGFEEPTEIQELTIPVLLKNEIDIIAQAQTGTGKTAAFALPLLEKLDSGTKGVQAIILAPTRELVIQVCEEINSLKGKSKLVIAPIYGGQSIVNQLKQLKRGVSIVVGTPGRILDHINRGSLKLGNIKYFVLDEADEMLNMGFVDDIETIMEQTPKEKRVLLFSATMPDRIKRLARRYMKESSHIKTETKLTANLTDQIYFEVSNRDKFEALCRIMDIESVFYGVVFCRTKRSVDEVVGHLKDRGYSADGLHGDITQSKRESILNQFKRKRLTVLVATDVAARGIDVDNLSHVINYSIPQNPESYVHRIGRTGRAGKKGTAITFVTSSEFKQLGFIKRVIKSEIRREMVPNAKDIIAIKKEKVVTEIKEIIDSGKMDKYRDIAGELLNDYSPEDVVAGVLKHGLAKVFERVSTKQISSPRSQNRDRSFVDQGGKTRLFIAKGTASNMTKKSIVDFIVNKAGVSQHLIDNVQVFDNFSFISVPFTEAEIIIKKFGRAKPGQRSVVERAKEKKRRS